MSVHNRIKKLREEKGMSQQELADAVGYADRSAVNKIEKGKVDLPQSRITAFAKALGVTEAYLLGIGEQKDQAIRIPVLGRVPAGVPFDAIQEIIDWEEISPDMASRGRIYALRVFGDSMAPRICDGDVVIVREQEDVDSGDTAIVMIDGHDATCKKVIKKQNGIMLMPLNPIYEAIFYDWNDVQELPIKILAKVIELRGKF